MAPSGEEEQVTDERTLHRAVLNDADIGFGVTDLRGRLRWLNPTLASLLGMPAERALGSSLPALLPGAPDGAGADVALVTPRGGEHGHRWLEVSCALLVSTGGLLYRAVDVTSWRDRELEATHQAQALNRGQRLGRMGTWEWYPAAGRVVWSEALLEMFGYPPATELSFETYASLVHPEDLPLIEGILRHALDTGERFTFSHRILLPDRRTELILECSGEVINDGEGSQVRVLGTAHDITQAHRTHRELLRMAEEDPLTGLPNRRALTRELERQLATGSEGALLLLDLDNFKDVNDLRGHAVGDRVMRALAGVVRARLRYQREEPAPMLGRLGGDEFAIVLPGASPLDAETVARRLGDAVAALPVLVGGSATRMTVSTGVAPFSSGQGWEAVLANADLALYASKDAGRNRVTVYDPAHYADTAKRVSVLDRLRAALEHGGFRLHAMPIVELCSRRTKGYELLLRLEDGQQPTPGPAEFLPAAERTDLVLEIDRWVLGQAVDTLAEHPDPRLRFNVNISGRTLEDEDFGDFVLDRLAAVGVAPGRLGFEITETAAVTNLDAARGLSYRLRAAGCRITLDDFGAGFGSFVHLKHLPITGLKIDGEFIRGIDSSTKDAVLVTGIVEIARGLGLTAVAEWVERPTQVDVLTRLGVQVAQGFHLGRPRPLRSVLTPSHGASSARRAATQDGAR